MLLQGPKKGPILLSADVDTYTSLLLEVVAKCEDASLNLKESSATVEMLKKEKANITSKATRLREESDTIYEQSQTISESYKINPFRGGLLSHDAADEGNENRTLSTAISIRKQSHNTPVTASSLSSSAAAATAAAAAATAAAAAAAATAAASSVHSTAVEQRVCLMRCVEDLYQQAVITQSASRKEQEALKYATKQAVFAYTESQARVIELNQRIEELQRMRAKAKDALKRYTQSVTVQDMQSNLIATIDHHDRMMVEYTEDKKQLLTLLEAAVKAEEELRKEINHTRSLIFSFQNRTMKVTSHLNFVQFCLILLYFILHIHQFFLFLTYTSVYLLIYSILTHIL